MKNLKKLFIIFCILLPITLFAGCKDKVTADNLVRIEVSSDFVNKTFYVGDSIDTENYSLKLTYASGLTSFVKLSDAIISGVNSSVAGKNTITITYNQVSQEVDIFFIEAKIDAIRYAGDTLHFYVGETASLDGITLLAHKENGEELTIGIDDCTTSALDLSFTEEERELEVSYGEVKTTIKYDVSYREIDLTKTYAIDICFDHNDYTATFVVSGARLDLQVYATSGSGEQYLVYNFFLVLERDNLYTTRYMDEQGSKAYYVYLANDTLIISQNPN